MVEFEEEVYVHIWEGHLEKGGVGEENLGISYNGVGFGSEG